MKDNYFYEQFGKKAIKIKLDNLNDFFKRSLKKLGRKKKILFSFLVFFGIFYLFFISAPFRDFPSVGLVVKIEEGSSLGQISLDLHKNKIIRSPWFFRTFVRVVGGEKKIKAGSYLFERSQGLTAVVWRMIEGEKGYDPIRVSIPEGASVDEIGLLLEEKIPDFSREEFLNLAKKEEGYLFPDTYFFPPDTTSESVIKTMKDNFNQKLEPLLDNIKNFGKTLNEIIIMASILEEEARTMESRQIISGILWKRLEIDMPLQVDATFLYINGKNTYELTLEDLQDDSSLYNTYTHKGLPLGPISNPGLDSIWATINPTKSNYLYYLSDKSGNMYYAEDFEEHKINKTKYLHTY